MTRTTTSGSQTPVLNDALSLTEVQIWPVRNPQASRIKAMAAITFNGALRVTGCRIVEGSKGLFLAYPSEKKPGTDQFFPLFHPVDRTLGDRIQHEVLARFQTLAI
ncbi:MAG TPA: septation protein SpoVG family protein [Fibrobacteria bacterium]|nr:septation protein SpoVG family protein [Fibrobacteria bacterium]